MAQMCTTSATHLGSTNPHAPKRHLDRFIRFCRTHCRDQDADAHTWKSRYAACVAIIRILCFAYQCGLTSVQGSLINLAYGRIVIRCVLSPLAAANALVRRGCQGQVNNVECTHLKVGYVMTGWYVSSPSNAFLHGRSFVPINRRLLGPT